eukprot:794475-Pyramimonas_sp.AAC.1
MFCLENRGACSKKLSARGAIYCKSVVDHVTKTGAPTGLDDKKASNYRRSQRGPQDTRRGAQA